MQYSLPIKMPKSNVQKEIDNKIDEFDIESLSLPQLFSRVLMCCFLYYKINGKTPWTDNQFDWACKKLYEKYDSFDHVNKNLMTKEDLLAGTGFSIEYTKRIQFASETWMQHIENLKRKDNNGSE